MAKARIIIVEDEVIIARDIQRTLTRLGYEVLAMVISAEDALEHVAAARPDLVLMDIHLSGAMDGIMAAEQLRSTYALPVVFLTAHSDEATLRRARVTGPYGYILKPFDERELEIVIDIALYRHSVELKLRQMERWMATTLKSIGDGVVATDTAGAITFMNGIAEALTGWTHAQALGRAHEEVLRFTHNRTREPVESLVARVLSEEMVIELAPDTLLIARDGVELPVADSAAPIRDDAGAITGVVIVFRDITARKQVEDRLYYVAMHDMLTGLPNRALLMDRLSRAFERGRRHAEHRVAVLYLDLDRFKVVNDSLGHLAGDQLLIATARRLEQGLRAEDTVARIGGDEFVVLLDGVATARDAIQVAERIQQQMLTAVSVEGHEVFTAASIGIALSGPAYGQPDDLLRDADAALYRAKAVGKGRYVLFDTALHERATALLRLENDLRRAVAREEFQSYYQPIVSLATGQMVGFEALIRWQHPERGLLPPGEFLDLAEEAGILVALSERMLGQACRQTVAWQALAPASAALTISVNISNSQFWQPELAEQVARVLSETGLRAEHLCLELTEGVIADHERATQTLTALDDLGVQLHVDDFGTGYSSLSMLHRAPIDTLKIDRSFIQRMSVAEPEENAIVQTILTLARVLKLAVVAEGIETGEQAACLNALGCDYGQGYWFAKPLPAEAATTLLLEAKAL